MKNNIDTKFVTKIRYLGIAIIVILPLAVIGFIYFGMPFIRSQVIKHRLEKTYQGLEIEKVVSNKTAVDNETVMKNSFIIWRGEKISDKLLYSYEAVLRDSIDGEQNEYWSKGYSTFWGSIIVDGGSTIYYAENDVKMFEDIVKQIKETSEVDIKVASDSIVQGKRLISIEDTKDYNKYLNPSTVGYYDYFSQGDVSLVVALDEYDELVVDEINKLLENEGFDASVKYGETWYYGDAKDEWYIKDVEKMYHPIK